VTRGLHKPSATNAPLIYVNATHDVQVVLGGIKVADGEIIVPKMEIGQCGFMAVCINSEGNRIALHSFVKE